MENDIGIVITGTSSLNKIQTDFKPTRYLEHINRCILMVVFGLQPPLTKQDAPLRGATKCLHEKPNRHQLIAFIGLFICMVGRFLVEMM